MNLNLKDKGFKVLNGMSIGIVVALMPSAIFGLIAKSLHLTAATNFFAVATALMAMVIGLAIAMQFKLDPISSGTLAMATMLAGGAVKFVDGAIMLKGAGDVLNASLGAIIALIIILSIGDKLKAYKLLILPGVTLMVVGYITMQTAAPVGQITKTIGDVIANFTTMQPLIMSILIAISFGIIIISPISSVAVAMLIGINGLGAAAATMGVLSVGLSTAVLSKPTNGVGTAIAHFLGSPKIQMANFIKRPIMVLPGLVTAALSAILVPFLNLQGTTASAGFGLAGLVGPFGHLEVVGATTANIIITILAFFVIPGVIAIITAYIAKNKLKIVKDDYYTLDIK